MASIRGSLANVGKAVTEPLNKPVKSSLIEAVKFWKWPGHIMGAGAAASGEAVKQGAKGAFWFIKQPIAGALEIFGFGIKAVRKHKVAAGVLALGTGAVFVANHMRDSAAEQTQQQLMNQAMGGNQQSTGYGPAVTPEEYAQMEARMKQGAAGQGSFAQTVAAKRESAAQQAAPVV